MALDVDVVECHGSGRFIADAIEAPGTLPWDPGTPWRAEHDESHGENGSDGEFHRKFHREDGRHEIHPGFDLRVLTLEAIGSV